MHNKRNPRLQWKTMVPLHSKLRIVSDLAKIKLHPNLISYKDVGDPSYRAAVNMFLWPAACDKDIETSWLCDTCINWNSADDLLDVNTESVLTAVLFHKKICSVVLDLSYFHVLQPNQTIQTSKYSAQLGHFLLLFRMLIISEIFHIFWNKFPCKINRNKFKTA